MGKLTYEDKLSIYKERKSGIGAITLSKKYDIRREKIYYLENLIDKHGYDILRTYKNSHTYLFQGHIFKFLVALK